MPTSESVLSPGFGIQDYKIYFDAESAHYLRDRTNLNACNAREGQLSNWHQFYLKSIHAGPDRLRSRSKGSKPESRSTSSHLSFHTRTPFFIARTSGRKSRVANAVLGENSSSEVRRSTPAVVLYSLRMCNNTADAFRLLLLVLLQRLLLTARPITTKVQPYILQHGDIFGSRCVPLMQHISSIVSSTGTSSEYTSSCAVVIISSESCPEEFTFHVMCRLLFKGSSFVHGLNNTVSPPPPCVTAPPLTSCLLAIWGTQS